MSIWFIARKSPPGSGFPTTQCDPNMLQVPTDKGDLSEGSVRVIEQMLYWELTSNNTDPPIVLIRAIGKGRTTHSKKWYTLIKGHYLNPK